MTYPLWKRAAVFGLAATITGLLLIDFCGWIYGCGCQSIWKSLDKYCNIHHGPKHCPWCTHGGIGFLISAVFVMGTQGLVAFKGFGLSLLMRFILCMTAFPTIGGIVAWIVGSFQGYWS